MSDLMEKVTVEAPLEDVFDIVADPEHAADMFVNVDGVERLNDRVREAGAKYREYRRLSNRRVGTDVEITAYEQEQLYEVRRYSNGLSVTYRYEFYADSDDKTTVNFEGVVKAERFLLKLSRPLLVKMLRREDRDHMKKFKHYIEKQRSTDENGTN